MKKMMEVEDVNRLITEIEKRPALWDKKNTMYHNRDVADVLWNEMSSLLNISKIVLKTKWKGLRDTFRVELKKDLAYLRNGEKGDKPTHDWIYYNSLQFLTDQTNPKQLNKLSNEQFYETVLLHDTNMDVSKNDDSSKKKNFNETTRTKKVISAIYARKTFEQCKVVDDSNDEPVMIKFEPIESRALKDCHESGTDIDVADEKFDENNAIIEVLSSDQIFTRSMSDRCIELKQDPLPVNGVVVDDNYLFLMSLLPHMSTLPPERQMALRTQMQELVYKEVYTKNTDNECILPF